MAKKTTQPATPAEEKKDEQKAEQIKLPGELKTELDNMKEGNETYADVIRRLIVTGKVSEAPEEGTVTLRMPEMNYRQLLVMQPSVHFSEMLRKARV